MMHCSPTTIPSQAAVLQLSVPRSWLSLPAGTRLRQRLRRPSRIHRVGQALTVGLWTVAEHDYEAGVK
jgi:hypothetical protein